ncbi:hypothetical protein MF271_24405 (plasmid) [Deinococcus sp. KNUC1210]|uniref:hypothetical protein n=1 Tax=Deinococcus sp. KNUC1210 TaxID=2917691 RepID=UPI001EF0D31A|nr:hypothetical protein [Deinococcus sp. KNUC1210]ULH18100.1 hypothetical protein MF271_24405 [Deinococcus sp. KNUC1210]
MSKDFSNTLASSTENRDQGDTPDSNLALLVNPQLDIVTMVAPAGYRKTSYLMAVQRRHPTTTVYLNAAEVDPDAYSISAYIHQRMTAALGPLRLSQSQLSYELQRPAAKVGALGAALRQNVLTYAQQMVPEQPLTFLLDNTHLLNSESRAFLITYLLAAPEFTSNRQHQRVRWIISMRTEADLPIRNLKTLLNIHTIQQHDLALTPQAMRALGMSDLEIQRVAGWPAAVALSTHAHDAADLVEDLLNTLDEQWLPSLRRASLLPTWRADDPAASALELRDGWLKQTQTHGIPCQPLGDGSFEPLPIVSEVLLRALRNHPSEYAAAQRALAGVQRIERPLTATSTYLAAGDRPQAQELLVDLTCDLADRGQLVAALPQLIEFDPPPHHPLYLALASSLYDSGQLLRGLEHAEAALAANTDPFRALVLLARMRLRMGQMELATMHFQRALTYPESQHDPLIRAQFALALAAQARTDHLHLSSTTNAEYQAQQVIGNTVSRSLDTAELLARTALTITAALRGVRDAARAQATIVVSSIDTLPPSADLILVLTELARYYADDQEHELAYTCLERATEMTDKGRTTEGVLLLSTARAYVALRFGDLTRAHIHATQAAQDAVLLHHHVAHRDLLLMLAILELLAPQPTTLHLDLLAEQYGDQVGVTDWVHLLHHLFVDGILLPTWRDTRSLPLEVQILATVREACAQPNAQLLHTELLALQRRVGPQAIQSYATLQGLTLPDQVQGLLRAPVVHVQVCCAQPQVLINHKPSHVRGMLLLPLMLLLRQRALDNGTIQTCMLEESASTRKSALSRLRTWLSARTDWPTALTRRGTLSVRDWQISFDTQRLEGCSLETLLEVYQAPVYANWTGEVPVPLQTWRNDVRTLVYERVQAAFQPPSHSLSVTEQQHVMTVWQRLVRRDPELAVVAGQVSI